MKAYFDDVESSIEVLTKLDDSGFKDEALTLCLVYIDRLAQKLMWPSDKVGFNYVAALTQFSHDDELGAVHPKQLAESLDRMQPVWHPIGTAVRNAFPDPSYELLAPSAIIGALSGLGTSQVLMLQSEIWRGTIAGISYYRMRNPAIHALGSSTLTFDGSTFRGQPARPLDLARLQAAARGLAGEARRRSSQTGEWFGNDLSLA